MHRIIIGSTGSGKTYYAKEVVKDFLDSGGRVVIFNPQKQDFDKRAEMFGLPEYFYAACRDTKKERCLMLVDELPLLFEHDKDKLNTFMTNARHYGGLILLVQRPRVVLSTTVLTQCDDVVCFAVRGKADRDFIAKNTSFSADELLMIDKTKWQKLYGKIN